MSSLSYTSTIEMVIKLYYFNGRGICEPIRWILSYGGIPFEDIRAPVNDKPLMLQTLPLEIKKKCRWGQAPLVEFEDGRTLVQSLAICRYFAKKCGLHPEDQFQGALCDELVDAIRDYWNGFFDALNKNSLDDFLQLSKSRFLNMFESTVEKNDGLHLVGDHMSWADIWMAFAIQHVKLITEIDVIVGYPFLQKLYDAVVNAHGIKEWIEKRPVTKF